MSDTVEITRNYNIRTVKAADVNYFLARGWELKDEPKPEPKTAKKKPVKKADSED